MGRAPAPAAHALRYGIATALVAAAAGISVLTRQFTEGSPFTLFFLAAVLAARFAGLGPSAFAVILGAAAAKYLLIPPLFSLALGPSAAFDVVGFMVVSGVACWITAALGAAQNRLVRILDSISEGFVVIDREWRHVYVNHQAAEMVGRRPDELIGRELLEVFPKAREMPFFQALREAMIHRRPARIEAYVPARDAWFEGRVMPAEHGLALFVQDVSDRVRVRQQLEATLADLARSNDALETFASTMSHDWVQPLASIGTYAALLADGASGDSRRYADKISESAHHMANLLRARRADSKAGARPDDLEATALDQVLENVVEGLEAILAGKGITVASQGLPTLKADPLLMRQLLHSLISCQLKSSGPGQLTFTAELEAEKWIVSLHNPCKPLGSGPPAEEDDDFTIAKRIAELHRGRMWCESGPDGNTIRFGLDIGLPIPAAKT